MPKPYPAAFRRQTLALLVEGRTVCDVVASLGCQRWANMDPVSVTENGPPRSGYSVFVAGGVRPRSRSLSR